MSGGHTRIFIKNPDSSISGFACARALSPPRDPPPPPSIAYRAPRLSCGRCRTVLEYNGSATFVQCPICSFFNAVGVMEARAGLNAGGFSYTTPERVSSIRQSIRPVETQSAVSVSTSGSVRLGPQQRPPPTAVQMICPTCRTTNMAPWGVRLVRCGACGAISDISVAYR